MLGSRLLGAAFFGAALLGAALLGAVLTEPASSSTEAPPAWEVLPSVSPPSPVRDDQRLASSSFGPSSFAPIRLVFDGFGVLYALDADSDRIHRLSPEGHWDDFGIGDQGGARFPSLRALQVRGPDLFALDSGEAVLYRMSLDGRLRARIPLVGPEGPLDAVDFLVDKSGELWVLDRAGSRLLKFGRNGEFLVDLAAGGAGADRLVAPTRLALDPEGGVYVLEPGARRVRRFSRQGELLGAIAYADAPTGSAVADLVVTRDALVLVDSKGRWIRSSDRNGTNATVTPIDVGDIAGGALSPDGVLYLAAPDPGRIVRLRPPEARARTLHPGELPPDPGHDDAPREGH